MPEFAKFVSILNAGFRGRFVNVADFGAATFTSLLTIRFHPEWILVAFARRSPEGAIWMIVRTTTSRVEERKRSCSNC